MTEDQIEKKLSFLNPISLNINDESALHKGHAGNNGGSHFNIQIISNEFLGKSRMERHRIIYKALEEYFPNKIHALSIKALTETESKS